jgi:hypothetical protein
VKASSEIDNLIAGNPDWRGEMLAKIRKIILEVDPRIAEEWKYMSSPVWSLDGQICIGNIFKNKVQLVFPNGADLPDHDELFNAGLTGKKWRYIDLYEGNQLDEVSLKNLIRAAVAYNEAKSKK